jgi:Amt family ammonium transporter
MDQVKQGTDDLFILVGAIMVLAMHSGFAFLEPGTVREKNQVHALVKILIDFAVSTTPCFFVGYTVADGTRFFTAPRPWRRKTATSSSSSSSC